MAERKGIPEDLVIGISSVVDISGEEGGQLNSSSVGLGGEDNTSGVKGGVKGVPGPVLLRGLRGSRVGVVVVAISLVCILRPISSSSYYVFKKNQDIMKLAFSISVQIPRDGKM